MPQARPSTWTWLPETPAARADVAILEAMTRALGSWDGADATASCSRSQLKRLMEEGKVTQAGSPLKPGTKLRAAAEVRVEIAPPRPLEVLAEDRPIEVLFEDEHLVVINKPPGLTVHPSETQMEGTLVNALLHQIKDLSGIGGVLRPGIVHRIDKDTSGALVVTKTDEAHRRLVETFARHDIERVYWALCFGSPAGTPGKDVTRVETRLGRNPRDRKRMAVLESGGREAITYYRKVEEYGLPAKRPFASWLSVTLETGRTHQIRVHLTSQGFSLLGDPAYGTPTEKQTKWVALPREVQAAVRGLPGQALHARVLGFAHPVTGERIHCEAEPPEGFRAVLAALQRFR